jgi:NAD-dependent dihydropyrimidine dehydrogenase PreA subunit
MSVGIAKSLRSQVIEEGIEGNTLRYIPSICINCGMCLVVCPHAVFTAGSGAVSLSQPERCIECGACQLNCPVGAIHVNAAMINAALKGSSEPCCGPDDDGGTGCC